MRIIYEDDCRQANNNNRFFLHKFNLKYEVGILDRFEINMRIIDIDIVCD